MPNKIIFDVSFGEGTNAYFARLKLTNIRREDGSSLMMRKNLGISLKSPVAIDFIETGSDGYGWNG